MIETKACIHNATMAIELYINIASGASGVEDVGSVVGIFSAWVSRSVWRYARTNMNIKLKKRYTTTNIIKSIIGSDVIV